MLQQFVCCFLLLRKWGVFVWIRLKNVQRQKKQYQNFLNYKVFVYPIWNVFPKFGVFGWSGFGITVRLSAEQYSGSDDSCCFGQKENVVLINFIHTYSRYHELFLNTHQIEYYCIIRMRYESFFCNSVVRLCLFVCQLNVHVLPTLVSTYIHKVIAVNLKG